MDLAELASCRELTAEHAEQAARSPDALRAILARAAELAQPEDGGPKILFVLARLARGDVGWIEGDVTVELAGNDEATTLDLFSEQGWGMRERLAPRARFAVPLDEFARAVEISARRFAPLRPSVTAEKVVLSSAPPAANTSPPALELDEKSIGTAPPPPIPIPMPSEPEPFALPPASEPDPFGTAPGAMAADSFADDPFAEGPGDSFGAFVDDPAVPPPPAAAPAPTPVPAKPKPDPVHSRPTVRRMVAIKPEALRTGRKDPRREEDD